MTDGKIVATHLVLFRPNLISISIISIINDRLKAQPVKPVHIQ